MADHYSENPPKNQYAEMVEKIGEKKFYDRLSDLQKTADNFISSANFDGYVVCNPRILLQVQLDYFADLYRLKDFHGIEHAKTEKILAYELAWLLKRKPLQFKEYTDKERDIFVNERFAVYLIINECLLSGEKRFVDATAYKAFEKYQELLFYYFKYRETNPQVIELIIESFKMGALVR